MSVSVEAWIDLLATALVPADRGPAVVIHEAQRVLPLLEQRLPVAWVHPRAMACADFLAAAHRQPVTRYRLVLDTHGADVADLLQRAALRVLALPGQEEPALAPLLGSLASDKAWLVYGRLTAPAWRRLSPNGLVPAGWVALPAPLGWQMWVSAPLAAGCRALQLEGGYGLALAQRLQARVKSVLPGLQLDVSADERGEVRLRLRQTGVSCVATSSQPVLHHVLVQNRAVFGPRGGAVVMLPWDGATRARLQLRNVRARVDDMHAALGVLDVSPEVVHYTDQGAIAVLTLPPLAPGHDALLHLSLPRAALPLDDFCDLGAAEFTVELAA